MKKIFSIAFFLIFSLAFQAQEKVNWLSFEKAIEVNKTDPKPFLIDIYTDWCGWCKKMDREAYSNAVIIKYINKNYHAVKLDGEGKKPITYKEYTFKYSKQGRTGYHELSALLLNGKLSYPTTVILNKDEELLDRVKGYLNTKQMEMVLAYFIKRDRKTKKWGDFSKNFKSQIKD